MKTAIALILAIPLVIQASFVRSSLAARFTVDASTSQDYPMYIESGLFFIGDSIHPPSSGRQTIPIGSLDTSGGFTIEVYGVPVATKAGCYLSLSESFLVAPFSSAWWARGDSVNLRLYNQEFFTGKYKNELCHLAYTCDSEKNFIGYVDGIQFMQKNVLKAQIPDVAVKIVGEDQVYFDIYCIRVYNRVLSDEEIAYNYSVDKLRFNLQ